MGGGFLSFLSTEFGTKVGRILGGEGLCGENLGFLGGGVVEVEGG